MRQALTIHPDSRCEAVQGIAVELSRPSAAALVLEFVVIGRIGDLRMPAAETSERSDELWRHSCFEAFVRTSSGPSYHELNFAPSTRWAAYRFDGYRSGMVAALEIGPPAIEVRSDADCHRLRASVDLSGLPASELTGPWQLGLSAVIEGKDGGKSYWAIAHPDGAPDFHHPGCFALQLAAAGRA
jgi:hypothetical protein